MLALLTWNVFLSFGALAKVDNMADPERVYDCSGSAHNGGTAARIAVNSCRLRMTAERALELDSFKPN